MSDCEWTLKGAPAEAIPDFEFETVSGSWLVAVYDAPEMWGDEAIQNPGRHIYARFRDRSGATHELCYVIGDLIGGAAIPTPKSPPIPDQRGVVGGLAPAPANPGPSPWTKATSTERPK